MNKTKHQYKDQEMKTEEFRCVQCCLAILTGYRVLSGRAKLMRRNTYKQLETTPGIMSDTVIEKINDKNLNRFWTKHFGDRDYVDWER